MYGNGYTQRGQPDLTFWDREIRKGIAFRKKMAKEAQWALWRKYYRGEYMANTMPVNLFFRMLRTIVPRVYFRNPSIVLTPGKPGLDMLVFTQTLQRLDNSLLRSMRVKQQMKKIVQDAFLFGTGVGKLGYGAQFTPTPEVGDTESPISGKGERFEYHSYVTGNMPWFMRVPTGRFIVPAGCDDYDQTRWSAVMVTRSCEDVKSDPRMKNAKDLKATKFSESLSPADRMTHDPDTVDLIEVRDKKFKTVFIYSSHRLDKPLYYGEDELQVNGRMTNYPLIFNFDDESFWGIPDAQILEPQQLEANEIRTQIMYHRRLAIARILAKRKSITEEEAARLVSEDVTPIIWVEGEMTDVKFSEGVQIPDSLLQSMEMVYRDTQETVGFSRNQFGDYASGSNDKSATESQIVNQSANIRVDERRDMVADMLTDVVEDMHSVIFEKWRDQQVIDLIGPNGLPVWVSFRPEMLKATGATVTIDPDSAAPVTKENREKRAFSIYQELKQSPLIDPMMLTRYFLQELDGSRMDYLIKQQVMEMGANEPGSNPDNPIPVTEYAGLMSRLGMRVPTGG